MQRWRAAWVVAGLVALCVVGRWMPHLPNFAPALAASLCAGVWLRNKWLAAIVPLAGMAISDAVLGGYHPGVMAAVYGTLLATTWLYPWLGARPGFLQLRWVVLPLSLGYFLTTNFAVWAFDGMYAPTLGGLARCYVAALPFLQYAVAGDLAYLALLSGIAALAGRYWPWIEDELSQRRPAYARVKSR